MTPRQPLIRAEFELGANGKPLFVQTRDLKHYSIRVSLADVSDDTYAVTYVLHESYADPVLESRNRSESFAEPLTTYGDYILQAKVRSVNGVTTVATPLSKALAGSYGAEEMTPAISEALTDIRSR